MQHMNLTGRQQYIPVEIKEDQPKEKSKGCLFRARCSKVASLCHLHSGRDSMAGRGEGKFYSETKGSLQVHPDWRLLGKLEAG